MSGYSGYPPQYDSDDDPQYDANDDPQYDANDDPQYDANDDPQYDANDDPQYSYANDNPDYADGNPDIAGIDEAKPSRMYASITVGNNSRRQPVVIKPVGYPVMVGHPWMGSDRNLYQTWQQNYSNRTHKKFHKPAQRVR